MKSIYSFILSLLLVSSISCDDGDVIVDEGFDFTPTDLTFCNTGSGQTGNIGSAVFFNINNTTNEVIAFEINNRFFDNTNESIAGGEIIPAERINVSYRKFDSNITANYFCSGIPDSNIQIVSELIGDRGNVEITTRNVTKLDDDDDGDGLSNEDENFIIPELATSFPDNFITIGTDLTIFRDSDSDGIPDFRDLDDDNDNVRTSMELNEDGTTRDTDEDGIPDHLDNDDDGDGVLTRNEISENATNPLDDENKDANELPHYLNSEVTSSFEATELLINRFNNSFKTSVLGRFIGLSDGTTTITRDRLVFGEFNASESKVDTVKIPEIVVEEMTPTEPTM